MTQDDHYQAAWYKRWKIEGAHSRHTSSGPISTENSILRSYAHQLVAQCKTVVLSGCYRWRYHSVTLMDNNCRSPVHQQWRYCRLTLKVLAIMAFHQPNTSAFTDGRKNINDIFNNCVCSESLMRPGLHFQNVSGEPWFGLQNYIKW